MLQTAIFSTSSHRQQRRHVGGGRRRSAPLAAEQLPRNLHHTVRNPRAAGERAKRRLLIGRTDGGRALSLVIERAVDPTTWLIVSGWDSTEASVRSLRRDDEQHLPAFPPGYPARDNNVQRVAPARPSPTEPNQDNSSCPTQRKDLEPAPLNEVDGGKAALGVLE